LVLLVFIPFLRIFIIPIFSITACFIHFFSAPAFFCKVKAGGDSDHSRGDLDEFERWHDTE
jgi:hypothetical protein